MKCNAWTVALVAAGVISPGAAAYAEEAQNPLLTAVSSTTLSGYVDTSAIWKFGSGNALLPGRAFDGASKVDGFNLNVVGLTLEKPLGEEQWAAGYRVDLLFGPDAVAYNPSANLLTGEDSDFAVKQAYANVLVPMGNGLDIKMGVFNTLVGYEVFESYLNPNYSRSYGWQLEPTQHTGILASYNLTEAVSISGGVANTWVWGINTRSDRGETHKAYMASLAIVAPDSWGFMSGSSLYAGVVDGFSGNSKDTVSSYVGVSFLTPVDGLQLGAAFDYRYSGFNEVTPDKNWAWALGTYLTYEISEKWKLSGRADWTYGSDGTFYNSGVDMVRDTETGLPILDEDTGDLILVSDQKNKLFALTITADYALWANVLTRFELRWDRALSDEKIFGGEGYDFWTNTWDMDPDRDAVTLALNLIFMF